MHQQRTLESALNGSGFVGLALTKVPAGYSCSVEFEDGHWSEEIVKTTAAEAVLETLLAEMVVKPLFEAVVLPLIAPPPY